MAESNSTLRKCSGCGELKAFSQFGRHAGGRDGLRARCSVCHNATRMRWVNANRDGVRERARKSAALRRATPEGAEKHRQSSIRYHHRNKEKVMAQRKARWGKDPVKRLLAWQRMSLHRLLRNSPDRKRSAPEQMLGYTAQELRNHIERQFQRGMSWELMGSAIHIDHIVPISWFVDRGILDARIVHALSNLQPMWATENRQKSDKVLTLL